MLSGWGNLVFFDTEEHQATERMGGKKIAQIPKLGSQWRIIYDFKPTEYLQASTSRWGISLHTGDELTPGSSLIFTGFQLQTIVVALCILNNQAQTKTVVEGTQLLKVGEWTRIEIGHEKVDEKYFLALSIGGREVGRKEVTDPELRKPTDVKIFIGHPVEKRCQPGFIRRLVVLEKR